jgi:hypothetical protein
MNERERTVSYYDLFIESRLHGATEPHPRPVPIGGALDIAFTQWGGQPFSLGASVIKVTLADWQRNAAKGEDYLVINRADASLPDIPLRHIETGATRMAGKDRHEGIDISCHVLIKRPLNGRGPALLLMTNGSSLPAARVCKLIGTLFRKGRELSGLDDHYKRPHPSGEEGKFVTLHSVLSVAGHQNATLADLLKGGTLEGVDLISDAADEIDTASGLTVTSIEYKLEQVRPRSIGVGSIQRAIAALRGQGIDPSRAKVRYKAPGGGRVESRTFDVAALEGAFVRRETIRFQDPIAARYEQVDKRVVAQLIALAEREFRP